MRQPRRNRLVFYSCFLAPWVFWWPPHHDFTSHWFLPLVIFDTLSTPGWGPCTHQSLPSFSHFFPVSPLISTPCVLLGCLETQFCLYNDFLKMSHCHLIALQHGSVLGHHHRHNFGSDLLYNTSTSVGWTTKDVGTNIHCAQRMISHDQYEHEH